MYSSYVCMYMYLCKNICVRAEPYSLHCHGDAMKMYHCARENTTDFNCTDPERIDFRLAVLVHRCMNGTAPRYLGSELQRVADIESRRRLRSASSPSLHVPRSLHKTIGDRAFPVAAAKV